jgi:hypothetical protein
LPTLKQPSDSEVSVPLPVDQEFQMVTLKRIKPVWNTGSDSILRCCVTTKNQCVDGTNVHLCRWVNVDLLLQHVLDTANG